MKNNLIIQHDITDEQIKELIGYTKNDSHIQKHTHDQKRFVSQKSFEEWREKKRDIFVLTDSSKELLGLIWFSKKRMPDNISSGDFDTTFAIRIYQKARGQRLSYFFMQHAFEKMGITRAWLSVRKINHVAIKLYTKFGFQEVKDIGESVIMTYERS